MCCVGMCTCLKEKKMCVEALPSTELDLDRYRLMVRPSSPIAFFIFETTELMNIRLKLLPMKTYRTGLRKLFAAATQFADDDGVANDDDDERDNESCEEAAYCNNLVTVWAHGIIVEANGLTKVGANLPKDHRGNAQTNSKNPGKDYNNRCLFNSALVLDPNWKHDGDTAIETDDDQEEDAAEHVEEHNRGGELAHEVAEDPLLHHHAGDAEWQEAAEHEV
ncbi:hypothetical protein INR49_006236 [Caranx melampygus]|nr:hypothetical protein INR49_006236 [Caranx melampygus]